MFYLLLKMNLLDAEYVRILTMQTSMLLGTHCSALIYMTFDLCCFPVHGLHVAAGLASILHGNIMIFLVRSRIRAKGVV